MAQFRKGAEAIASAATRKGGGSFTPTHQFEDGETRYLQFLQPIDDIPTVLMHRFIIVGTRDDGKPIYAEFISRKDPSLDGANGYDPIWDRFDFKPTERTIALAVELEPYYEDNAKGRKVVAGFDVVPRSYTDKEGTEIEVPNVALVIESPYTFFNHLASYADIEPIEDVVFAVKRNGKGTNTSYTLMKAGEALDLEDLEIEEFLDEFDFDEYLDELADEDKVHELIDPLPDDHLINAYAKRGKGKKGETAAKREPSKSQRTRRAAAVEPDEPEDTEPEGEEDTEPEAESEPVVRNRRFGKLREEAAAEAKPERRTSRARAK